MEKANVAYVKDEELPVAKSLNAEKFWKYEGCQRAN